MIVFLTDHGTLIKTGCFFDSISRFAEAVIQTHGRSSEGTKADYCKEYLSAIELVRTHEKIWSYVR